MKIEKLSLGSIKNVLSRAELKKIMAGSGPGGAPPGDGGGDCNDEYQTCNSLCPCGGPCINGQCYG